MRYFNMAKTLAQNVQLIEDSSTLVNETALCQRMKARLQTEWNNLLFQIFWHEKIAEERLRDYQTDKEKQAMLMAWAFNCHRFDIVSTLLEQGADLTPIQINALEEAATLQQLFAGETTSHTQGRKLTPFPAEKYFGQTLGISMVGQNGINAQRGYLAPAMRLLAEQFSDYAASASSSMPFKNEIQTIAKAYEASEQACQFYYNRPSPDAAEKLNQSYQAGNVTIIPASWNGHAIGVALVGDHLILTNRGIGGDAAFGTKIYNIAHPEHINTAFFDTLLSGAATKQPPSVILNAIGKVVNPNPVLKINAKQQKRDNCIYANPKALSEGILAVLAAKKQGLALSNAESLLPSVKSTYKTITNHFRESVVNKLISDYQSCVSSEKERYADIMQAYIDQHSGPFAKTIDQQLSAKVSVALAAHPQKMLSFENKAAHCANEVAPLSPFQMKPRLVY